MVMLLLPLPKIADVFFILTAQICTIHIVRSRNGVDACRTAFNLILLKSDKILCHTGAFTGNVKLDGL
jgi:hypothetical protein